jgi:hypothetical protein
MAKRPICSIADCGKPHKGHGFCSAHYGRFKRYGDPFGGRTSPGTLITHAKKIASDLSRKECISWPYALGCNGYGILTINRRKIPAHRFICELAHGAPPTLKHEAAHTCGKGHEACINPSHLRWATKLENQADRKIHGTDPRGERHPSVKLNESQVREIRALKGKMSGPQIANIYGITHGNVWAIHTRKSWGWLSD